MREPGRLTILNVVGGVGTNRVVGTRPQQIAAEALRILGGDRSRGGVPALWDGQAAARIVEVLRGHAAVCEKVHR